MIAFHNDIKIKDKYIQRVQDHAKADEIVKGSYWENGKGCAVGCTIHGNKHERYETELGIPEWLARVEDTIFEGLPNERAKLWPEEFLSAITPGVDLEQVKNPFLILILERNIKSMDACVYDKAAWPAVEKAIEQSKAATVQMIDALKNNGDVNAARSAAESAWSAAESAGSAAWSAAESAESAAWSARSAARSAAESAAGSAARSAAWSARSAAWSAARSAGSAAWSAARSAAYEYFADELLKLLRDCK